jgi:RNA polymerase sigma factor (sigma-70 family)
MPEPQGVEAIAVSSLKARDEKSTVALFEYLLPQIRLYLTRLSARYREPLDVEDLTQEVVLALYERLPELLEALPDSTSPEELRSKLIFWAHSLGRNYVHSRRRHAAGRRLAAASHEESAESLQVMPEGPDGLVTKELLQKLEGALLALPREERELIEAHLTGETSRQISERTGLPPRVLYLRISRIRTRLQKALEGVETALGD